MARKNRASVYDGVYHVTARIAHRAMLLAEDEIKDQIMEWIVSIAMFSGVEVWAFAIMDNHLHLLVHVPPVPMRLWTDPGDEPCAYAFGMRPPECREPLWTPPAGDSPLSRTAGNTSAGDSPSAHRPTAGDSPSAGDSPRSRATVARPWDRPQRPALGFTLDDEEMVGRLVHLYGPRRAEAIGRTWASMRARGGGAAVDREKERLCRRMYNLTQFVKTLKERVSMWFNAEHGHSGCLWQGRFHSGIVEKKDSVKAAVSGYIGYNPVKAGLVPSPEAWRWSSWSLAAGDAGELGAYCREMYGRMLGRPWEEARRTLEAVYADGLPESVSPEDLRKWYDDYDGEAGDGEHSGGAYRASQAIRSTLKAFTGDYIGSDMAFFRRVAEALPARFPRAGSRSIRRCRAFRWELPDAAPLEDVA